MKEPGERWERDTPVDHREYRFERDRFASLCSDGPVAIAGAIAERVNGQPVELTIKQPGWVVRTVTCGPYPPIELSFPENTHVFNAMVWGP